MSMHQTPPSDTPDGGVILGADPAPPADPEVEAAIRAAGGDPNAFRPTDAVNGSQPVSPQQAPPQQQPQGQRVFSAEEVERIRREEKDKLYPKINSLESQLQELARERDERLAREAEERRQQEEAAARAAEEEMSAKELLKKKDAEWQKRFQDLEIERDKERALRERETAFNRLMEYRQRRIQEEAEEIMPELIDLVNGNNEEEIEQSLATMKARTRTILDSVQHATLESRRGMVGPTVTAPPVGPMENEPNTQQISAEDIRNMPMSEYIKNRDRFLGGVNSQIRERGLYG